MTDEHIFFIMLLGKRILYSTHWSTIIHTARYFFCTVNKTCTRETGKLKTSSSIPSHYPFLQKKKNILKVRVVFFLFSAVSCWPPVYHIAAGIFVLFVFTFSSANSLMMISLRQICVTESEIKIVLNHKLALFLHISKDNFIFQRKKLVNSFVHRLKKRIVFLSSYKDTKVFNKKYQYWSFSYLMYSCEHMSLSCHSGRDVLRPWRIKIVKICYHIRNARYYGIS